MQRVVYEDFTKILFTSPHGNGIPVVATVVIAARHSSTLDYARYARYAMVQVMVLYLVYQYIYNYIIMN